MKQMSYRFEDDISCLFYLAIAFRQFFKFLFLNFLNLNLCFWMGTIFLFWIFFWLTLKHFQNTIYLYFSHKPLSRYQIWNSICRRQWRYPMQCTHQTLCIVVTLKRDDCARIKYYSFRLSFCAFIIEKDAIFRPF